MILSFVFLFLMLLLITAVVFYLFCFFIPALKLKYDGISTTLATKIQFYEDDVEPFTGDRTKIAAIDDSADSDFEKRLLYQGDKNCLLFHNIYNSEYKNPKICIGVGDCVRICPQEAIKIRFNRAEIMGTCNGCGKCIDYCPEHIISLVPRSKKDSESFPKGFKFWAACYKLLSWVWG